MHKEQPPAHRHRATGQIGRLVPPFMLLAAVALTVVSITPAAATTAGPASPISMESTPMRYDHADIDGIKIFYREAGDPSKPTILLLHGFPSSSHMYRDLIPLLARDFHVVAPDYPGSGYSDAPPTSKFSPTFANLAKVMNDFTTTVGLKEFVIYMQDFGGPVGFRMAVQNPERVKGLIVQNANAYEEGIMPQELAAMKERAAGPLTAEGETQLDMILSPSGTEFLYKTGVRDFAAINPDAYRFDDFVLAKPENRRFQHALLVNYYDNVLHYPKWHDYMQEHQARTLILWGKGDPLFLPAGAEAYKRHLPKAELHFFDTGHFALEEDAPAIAEEIIRFFGHRALNSPDLVKASVKRAERRTLTRIAETQSDAPCAVQGRAWAVLACRSDLSRDRRY